MVMLRSYKNEGKALTERARRIIGDIVAGKVSPDRSFRGRGIVTCAGGYKYFTNAWILIRMLRHFGCKLPIQLWHLGPAELDERMRRLIAKYDVECIDGVPVFANSLSTDSSFIKHQWILKSTAISRCPFEEVIFLDADNLPILDPAFLFETPQYARSSAIFWPHTMQAAKCSPLSEAFGLQNLNEVELEGGQMVFNK